MNRVSYELLEPYVDHLLMGYKGVPFTGVAVEYTYDQKVLAEVSYINGQRNGRAVEWAESGRMLRNQNYKFDSLNGACKEWFESGMPRIEAEYELGICKSRTEWDESGGLVSDFRLTESDPQFKTLLQLRKAYAMRFATGADDAVP